MFCLFQHIRQQGKESMDLLSADAVAVKGFFEWLFKGNPVHTRFIRLFPLNHIELPFKLPTVQKTFLTTRLNGGPVVGQPRWQQRVV